MKENLHEDALDQLRLLAQDLKQTNWKFIVNNRPVMDASAPGGVKLNRGFGPPRSEIHR